MIVVDTSVWIDYWRGTPNPHTLWLLRNMDQRRLSLTTHILCEVLQGLPSEQASHRALRELSNFQLFAADTPAIAIASARNYRLLRSRGLTVRKTIDCLIATFCLEQHHILLHRDRDFDHFEQHLGLQVLHPSREVRTPEN